ncbi:glycosyltransferase family 4 protein [Neptuniibacter sp. SY11_33]|uniref:glycosyltransferase family 4 protein n=1 Tax=Neptuniibacter sp. SY11_33 TaxID=3398215 RepID=UPI0039F53436
MPNDIYGINMNNLEVDQNVDICHLASAHKRNDTRIGVKMARSAIEAGYSVGYVVADGDGEENLNGLNIYGTKRFRHRLLRMIFGPIGVYKRAMKLKAKIYHLHDPELLLLVPFLKLFSKSKFVFDSHEDVPVQFLGKPYLTEKTRKKISWVLEFVINFLCARVHGIVGATPFIRDKLSKVNPNAVDICNFPKLSEFEGRQNPDVMRSGIAYVGNIGDSRGIIELLDALQICQTGAELDLVGMFPQAEMENRARSHFSWGKVKFHGWVGRQEVSEVLRGTLAGIVTLKPLPNYIDALPVKMFEYMGAGVPVIASDFPVLREIIEEYDCGIVVDPLDPQAIADAIDFFVNNPSRALEMGLNGRKAAEKIYNWGEEERKLLRFYEKLL